MMMIPCFWSHPQRARPNARRKRIPAFGEWNHHGGGGGSWPAATVTPFFDLAAVHGTPNKTVRMK